MMSECGVTVDHTTLYRLVQQYAPVIKKRVEWYQKKYCNRCFIDET
jgi:transposase, IS6 family